MDKGTKPTNFSIFTKESKKLADVVTNIDFLNPANLPKPKKSFGEIPKMTERNTPGDISFDIKLTEKNKVEMRALQELLFKDVEKQLSEFYAKVEEIVEHIMRNYVTPPIKGEITKGKVKWRGLQLVWQETDTYDAFVGVRQRDWLIFPDGKKIPWSSLVNIEED